MTRTPNGRLTTWAALAAALAVGGAAAPRAGASGAPPAEHGAKEAAEPAIPKRTDVLNLEMFHVRWCRTTDREIMDVRFGLWLVLSAKTTEADYHELASWKHRLRDQAVIAVRSAAEVDFADPELERLQQLILYRVKRLPIAANVIGVYVIDFTLDEGETAEDYFRPAIIPSAAPAKKKSGGH